MALVPILSTVLLAAAVLAGQPAQASTAKWFVKVEASEPLAMARGETLPAFSLVPQRAFELSEDARPAGGKFRIPRGTLFVEVGDTGSGKYCAMARHLGSAFHCLADRDHDGSIETYYYQQVFNEFYFGSTFGEDGATALQSPARLRELDPFTQIAPVALGLRFDGGKPGGKVRFKLCVEEPSGAANWRKGLYKACLAQELQVDPGTGIVKLFGIDARVSRLDDKRVSVSIPTDVRIVSVTLGGTRY